MNSGILKVLVCVWLALSLGGVAATGCGQVAEDDALGGETHWLRTCVENSDCGPLECLCGVCTAVCDDESTCGAISSGARCVARGEPSFPGECGSDEPARLCAEPSPGASGTGDGGDTPFACGADEVQLLGECLECEAARQSIVDRLQARIDDSDWNTCETDADCISQEWSTPCDGQCNVAIASAAVDEFGAGIGDFVSGVCDPETWGPKCGAPRDVDCQNAPLCVAGRCRIGAVGCDERAPDRCTQDGLCAASGGFPYVPDLGCFSSALEPVGCVDPDRSCPPVVTPALDDEGRCFSFGGCLPAGFTPAPEGHPCRADLAVTCVE